MLTLARQVHGSGDREQLRVLRQSAQDVDRRQAAREWGLTAVNIFGLFARALVSVMVQAPATPPTTKLSGQRPIVRRHSGVRGSCRQADGNHRGCGVPYSIVGVVTVSPGRGRIFTGRNGINQLIGKREPQSERNPLRCRPAASLFGRSSAVGRSSYQRPRDDHVAVERRNAGGSGIRGHVQRVLDDACCWALTGIARLVTVFPPESRTGAGTWLRFRAPARPAR